jgi:hypothetical protein
MFTPNKTFRQQYDRTYRKYPVMANVMLIMMELANATGGSIFETFPDKEVSRFIVSRFENPRAYQLPGEAR